MLPKEAGTLHPQDVQKEIAIDTVAWQAFAESGLTFSPKNLASLEFPVFTEFADFSPKDPAFILWIRKNKEPSIYTNTSPQTLLMLLGISGSGKDTNMNHIQELNPTLLVPIITHTSRPMRTDRGENMGKPYDFISHEAFERKEYFVETMPIGTSTYGTAKENVRKAYAQAQNQQTPYIIWRGNIQRIDEMTAFANVLHIPVISMFLMPNKTWGAYTAHLIKEERDQVEERMRQAQWEIQLAGKKADIVVVNKFNPDHGIDNTTHAIIQFLHSLQVSKP